MNYVNSGVISKLDQKPEIHKVHHIDVRTATGTNINIEGKCVTHITIAEVTLEVPVYVSNEIQLLLY